MTLKILGRTYIAYNVIFAIPCYSIFVAVQRLYPQDTQSFHLFQFEIKAYISCFV
jgi:hypothetical protein